MWKMDFNEIFFFYCLACFRFGVGTCRTSICILTDSIICNYAEWYFDEWCLWRGVNYSRFLYLIEYFFSSNLIRHNESVLIQMKFIFWRKLNGFHCLKKWPKACIVLHNKTHSSVCKYNITSSIEKLIKNSFLSHTVHFIILMLF